MANYIYAMKSIITFTAILTIISSISIATAQVTIAPTNLFVAENARFGTYMVINNSNETQEISIDFAFAYTESDEQGYRTIVQDDQQMREKHSIAEYIRAFPRNFTLAPGQRQVIRLRLNPPNELEDGTYWARIKTASTPETPPIELQTENTVAARVGIRVEQVTGIFYKKGDVATGIDIEEIRTEYDSESGKLIVLIDHLRTGNSPFLGSITTSIIDSNGQEVRRGFLSTSLYFDGIFRQEFEIDDIPNGEYLIRTTFESRRSDIPDSDLVQMPNVTETTTFIKR
jgi:P pilus assembly chaperone PapD